MKKQGNRELKYHLAGWILFVICAIFFIVSSLKNHDTLALIASIIFLIACIIFLIPLFESFKKMDADTLR
jgi:predicted membrane channel-forming protein YqfA (hemolysin III family)